MKCAVAIVLALIGMVVTNPVAPLGHVAIGSPLLLPSAVSVSSSVINHGVSIPRVAVVPVVSKVVVPQVITPVIGSVSAWPSWSGWGLGNWGSWGSWGNWGLGKGWH